MDPYGSYVCSSDFDTSRTRRSNAPVEDSKLYLAQAQQQQQLPPFRELLGTGGQIGLDSTLTGTSATSLQGSTMTRRTFQPASGPLKIEPPSPEQLQAGSSIDNFENMSVQSGDSTYAAHRHHRQNSSWTSPPQYTELVSPYGSQQRAPCTIQTQFPPPKVEPILPSIHDLTTYPSSYTPGSYAFGSSTGPYSEHRSYPIKPETPYSIKAEQSYFDSGAPRYGQSYPQINRPSAARMEYPRYGAIYDYHQKGITFPSPYPVEYIPSPTNSHHPVSPTVSNGDGCGLGPGGRKRRGNLPKHITDYLKGWFMAHLEHPYPTEDDKQQFVIDTNLSIAQISNWFINARRRHLPAWRHQAQENSRRAAQASIADYDADHGRRSHKSFD